MDRCGLIAIVSRSKLKLSKGKGNPLLSVLHKGPGIHPAGSPVPPPPRKAPLLPPAPLFLLPLRPACFLPPPLTCLCGYTLMWHLMHSCPMLAQELPLIHFLLHLGHLYSPKQRFLPWYGVRPSPLGRA